MAGSVIAPGEPDEGTYAAIANGELARSQDRLDDEWFQQILEDAGL
jgi:hypothetical protein